MLLEDNIMDIQFNVKYQLVDMANPKFAVKYFIRLDGLTSYHEKNIIDYFKSMNYRNDIGKGVSGRYIVFMPAYDTYNFYTSITNDFVEVVVEEYNLTFKEWLYKIYEISKEKLTSLIK